MVGALGAKALTRAIACHGEMLNECHFAGVLYLFSIVTLWNDREVLSNVAWQV